MTDPHRPDPDRDPLLDAAWKAHSTELPPARVDAAILAAAHREARTRPQPIEDDAHARARAPFRAWWAFAAAATIGAIAFGVVQLAPPPVTEQATIVASDVPSGSASSPQPSPPKRGEEGVATTPREARAPPAEAEQRANASAPPRDEPRTAMRQEKARATTVKPADSAPHEFAPPEAQQRADAQASRDSAVAPEPTLPRTAVALPRPFPAQEAPSLAAAAPPAAPPAELAKAEGASSAPASRRRESDERRASAPAAQADAAAPTRTPTAKLAMRTPASWIERISMLHAEQRFDEAARELNAFRDAYPDADTRLPATLAAWAAGIKRN